MSGGGTHGRVDAPEDLLARSLALHVVRRVAHQWGRPVRADDIVVTRYLAAPLLTGNTVPHDLIVVLAPREISGDVVAQVRAMGATVSPKGGRNAR